MDFTNFISFLAGGLLMFSLFLISAMRELREENDKLKKLIQSEIEKRVDVIRWGGKNDKV